MQNDKWKQWKKSFQSILISQKSCALDFSFDELEMLLSFSVKKECKLHDENVWRF